MRLVMENLTCMLCSSARSKLILSENWSNRIILLCNHSNPLPMLQWNSLSDMSPLQSSCAGYALFGCVSDTLHRIHSAGRWYVTSLQVTWSTLILVHCHQYFGSTRVYVLGYQRMAFLLLFCPSNQFLQICSYESDSSTAAYPVSWREKPAAPGFLQKPVINYIYS